VRSRISLSLALALSILFAGVLTGPASAGTTVELKQPPPKWFTPAFKKRAHEAGRKGVPLRPGFKLPDACPGIVTKPGVSAAGCIVAPAGCTANFIFYSGSGRFTGTSDGRSYYIGTAGHCVDAGERVFMQVATPGVGPSIAEIGKTAKSTGDGGVGRDAAIIRIYKGFRVNPDIPIGGPQGIYTGCGPREVKHYGHGYGVAVAQGKPAVGLATKWYDAGYGWTGPGIQGDSGAAVNLGTNQAAGDLTHLNLPGFPEFFQYPGSTLLGTRVTEMLRLFGSGFHVVNQDGSLSRETSTNCGSPPPSPKFPPKLSNPETSLPETSPPGTSLPETSLPPLTLPRL
jgi:hypothetical protein